MKKGSVVSILICILFQCLILNALYSSTDQLKSTISVMHSTKKDTLQRISNFEKNQYSENFFKRNEETFITIIGTLLIALFTVLLTQLFIKKRESTKKTIEYFSLINNLVVELYWQTDKIDESRSIIIEAKRIFHELRIVITHLPKASLDYSFVNESRNILLKYFRGSKKILPFMTYYVNQVKHINASLELNYIKEYKDLYNGDEFNKTVDTIFTNLISDFDTLKKIVTKLDTSLAEEINNAPRNCKPTLFTIPDEISKSLKK